MTTEAEAEIRQRLLWSVKKEVKQIMEEAVTKKFVHEESGSITALCGAVENCLLHGLRKRALGLFKNSSTTALLQKVSKTHEASAAVLKILGEQNESIELSRKSMDSSTRMSTSGGRHGNQLYAPKYLWIRLALFDKKLSSIIDYLADNNSKYYEKSALIADPVDGPILASLLVGPCALDYTKMKTADHYWTDPPADELVQRHRIHSSYTNHIAATGRPDSPKRPGLQPINLIRRHTSSSSEESMRSTPVSAKEYVESLHQNSRTTLLYGKNNVLVQPKDDVTRMAGYLSLHQGVDRLTITWTPNQLMNGCYDSCGRDEEQVDRRPVYAKYVAWKRKNGVRRFLYWDYAVTIHLEDIVYLHCHQQPETGGTIVLVGKDGVQRPPIHFPRGGHMLAFISCLETGLSPNGALDPPLWSQRGKGALIVEAPVTRPAPPDGLEGVVEEVQEAIESFAGRVFPKLRKKSSQTSRSFTSQDSQTSMDSFNGSMDGRDDETCDYVFRLVSRFQPTSLPPGILDPQSSSSESNNNKQQQQGEIARLLAWFKEDKVSKEKDQPSAGDSSTLSSQESLPVMEDELALYARMQLESNEAALRKSDEYECATSAVRQLCDTMKRQIISRAFYGWLAHCRHLKTVRTHLSGLLLRRNGELSVDAYSTALTLGQWQNMFANGVLSDADEFHRLVYFGGCDHEIRRQVWPFLLGHYHLQSSPQDREEQDEQCRARYEHSMSEWMAVEAIVRQRDKEVMAANLAKLSQESQDAGQIPLVRKDSNLSNDVFVSMDSDDFSHPETIPEMSSSATSPLTEATPSEVASARISLSSGDGERGRGPLGSEQSGRSVSARSASGSEVDSHVTVAEPEEDATNASEQDSVPATEPASTSLLTQNACLAASRESLAAPASPTSVVSNGGVYGTEVLDNVAMNIHRIDKDVQRCDRNYYFFTHENLDKLRNVMCTYVWEHIEVGYIQGMCDLAAPLLVIFEDEAKAHACFVQLMKRMVSNFPHGGAMDKHFANMRSLIQILDPELFEHMHQHGDYTHFYFCYRWFLLDFKRELVYDDVFQVWETIWAANHVSSNNFVLFIALALVEYYREIILDNNMDFTDIIKFFNEMAEQHNAKEVLRISRDLVHRLQDLIDNK